MSKRTIDEILADGQPHRSRLVGLLRRARERVSWTEQLRALLPEAEARQYVVANVRENRLTVHAASASWATRLRFRVPELLESLRQLQDFSCVEKIRIRATRQEAPPPASEGARIEPAPSHPPLMAEALLDLADDTDYVELKEAVLRLAAHGKAKPKSQIP